MLPWIALCLALPAPIAATPAQGQVWVVDYFGGPGSDFWQIQDAVAAASDGDTVLVRTGGYKPFTIAGKALRVLADTGAQVYLPTFPNGALMAVGDLPVGSTTLLRGLTFVANTVGPGIQAETCIRLQNDHGTVWMESCMFTDGPTAAIVVEGDGDVVLESCRATGDTTYISDSQGFSSPAVLVTAGRVTIHGGRFEGGAGISPGIFGSHGFPGEPGVRLVAGELDLSATTLVGGQGGNAGGMGTCYTPGTGGPGLIAENGLVRARDVAFVGGAAGLATSFGCPDGAPGVPYQLGAATLTVLDGLSSTLESNSPVREGQTLTLRLSAEIGGPRTALLLASQTVAPTFVPALTGMGLLGGPTRRIELGTVDPVTGQVVFQMTVPELGAGVLAAPWLFQAYVCSGGTCSAGGATHTLWLDASL